MSLGMRKSDRCAGATECANSSHKIAGTGPLFAAISSGTPSEAANSQLRLGNNNDKAKYSEKRGRKAMGSRFLREGMVDLPKDPRPAAGSRMETIGENHENSKIPVCLDTHSGSNAVRQEQEHAAQVQYYVDRGQRLVCEGISRRYFDCFCAR